LYDPTPLPSYNNPFISMVNPCLFVLTIILEEYINPSMTLNNHVRCNKVYIV